MTIDPTSTNSSKSFYFLIDKKASAGQYLGKDGEPLGRAGVICTPHGRIETPCFVPVGTRATVKGLLPEVLRSTGAQAVLANAYHLYLRPGSLVVEEAGGLGKFMNWSYPTFTDSGGFQVMSLGCGYKKVISLEQSQALEQNYGGKARNLVKVDDKGVTFRSHIDGSTHRFTPEISMQIQHELGADIIFAFDECTTLAHDEGYQRKSALLTLDWAKICLDTHAKLTWQRKPKPYQALYAVVQGANNEQLRTFSTKALLSMRAEIDEAQDYASLQLDDLGFDGYGIGGALEKEKIGLISSWVTRELPENKPRHLLGISDPENVFAAVEAGVDTFDCVAPSRQGRNGSYYTETGRINVKNAKFRRKFTPISDSCGCYTCKNYTLAYLHHLQKSGEMLASILGTIHNETFIINLVARIRQAILDDNLLEMKAETLGKYNSKKLV